MNDQYTYRLSQPSDDGEYVATCDEFPSVSWVAAAPEMALRGLWDLINEAAGVVR